MVFGSAAKNDAINKPYGLAIYRGIIYACDTKRNLINIFDVPGERFGYLGTMGPGKLKKPINITIDADGTRFVADAGRGDIVMFNKNDDYLGSFGAAELERPVDIAVNDSLAFVCDAATNEVVVFRKHYRRYAYRFGGNGTKAGKFARPTNIALDRDGNVYVSDTINGRVQKLDRTGKPIQTFGRLGVSYGEFARPKGIALDHENRLYTVDAAFENVQIFDPSGQLLMFFGGAGTDPGQLTLPASVVIDYTSIPFFEKLARDFKVEYLVLVSSQYGPNKISVYAFGQPTGAGADNEETAR